MSNYPPPKLFSPAKIELFIIYIIIIIFALAYILPFFWLLLNSLKTGSEIAIGTNIFPDKLRWENYATVFWGSFPFSLYLRNTLIIVSLNIIGAVISNVVIGYGFGVIPWIGRDKVFLVVIFTLLLPTNVLIIQQFLLFYKLGWIGTFAPLTVPAFFGNPFFIFLMRQFTKGIPSELHQSAEVDGAGEWRIFATIYIPLLKPVMATVAIFTFLFSWNDFVGPLIMLSNNSLYTLSLGIQQIMSENDPRWPILMAAGVSMTFPILVLFFILQKYFIEGIALSGVKG